MKELFLLRCINHYFISSISCRIFLNVHRVTARSSSGDWLSDLARTGYLLSCISHFLLLRSCSIKSSCGVPSNLVVVSAGVVTVVVVVVSADVVSVVLVVVTFGSTLSTME